MPAITLVMVLTNVGLQLFNNWRNTQTSDEMRRKQQEFQRAAQNRNHDRMLQLLREGQAMQEQWENENHKQRITNINADFDNLIKRTLHSQALQSWPLSVLPMVMKNQSLGSFRTQSDENLALHVILTPSNSDTFNTSVFSQIELGVEAFCNQYWNNLSQHPIIFYGGAWKSKSAPEQTEIDQLKADLTHLPVLMITPYFTHDTGNLAFNINMWGMGNRQTNRNNEQFDINATEMVIKPTEQEFSYYKVYAQDTNYGDELTEVTIEEFVPYLQCMIGYLADVYFWSAHHIVPLLPHILSDDLIKTNSHIDKEIANAYSEYYLSVSCKEIQEYSIDKKQINSDGCLYPERYIFLLQSIIAMNHDKNVSDRMINNTLALIYENRTGERFVSSSTMDVRLLDYDIMHFVSLLYEMAVAYGSKEISGSIKNIIRRKILSWE